MTPQTDLFFLSIQSTLRAELTSFTFVGEAPTFDEPNSLPYLDTVVRETLGLHAPAYVTLQEATRDCVIPLSQPFVDKNSIAHHCVEVPKGTDIIIPLLAMDTSETIWGPDGRAFRPH